jgi:hypothetical protein
MQKARHIGAFFFGGQERCTVGVAPGAAPAAGGILV